LRTFALLLPRSTPRGLSSVFRQQRNPIARVRYHGARVGRYHGTCSSRRLHRASATRAPVSTGSCRHRGTSRSAGGAATTWSRAVLVSSPSCVRRRVELPVLRRPSGLGTGSCPVSLRHAVAQSVVLRRAPTPRLPPEGLRSLGGEPDGLLILAHKVSAAKKALARRAHLPTKLIVEALVPWDVVLRTLRPRWQRAAVAPARVERSEHLLGRRTHPDEAFDADSRTARCALLG